MEQNVTCFKNSPSSVMKASKKKSQDKPGSFFDTRGQSRRHEVSKTQYAHLPMSPSEAWTCAFDLVERTLRDAHGVGR